MKALIITPGAVANFGQVMNEGEVKDAEAQMDTLQHAFMVSLPSEVSTNSCPNCIETMKTYCELNDKLIRELEDAKYNGYQLRKAQKPLKEKLDAQTKDYRRIHKEYSDAANQLIHTKEEILRLNTEIGTLKAQLAESDLQFKKFEMSGTLVENMFTNHLKYTTENKTKKGLGYNHVPPPWGGA